jgi:type 1 glutamine amidotransferase
MIRSVIVSGVVRAVLCTGVVAGALVSVPATAQSDTTAAAAPRYRVLVFTKTAGYRHVEAIAAGTAAIKTLGERHHFAVEHSEDAALINARDLDRFQAVVFLNTTGDVLDTAQQRAFESYIAQRRGFIGIHSAADTEYGWEWYGQLVGAYFAGHPQIQPGVITVADREFPATDSIPVTWRRTDEWYNFRSNPRGRVRVLLTLDEQSYKGGTMGTDHPIAWAHEFGGGRALYTGLGHTAETYAEPLFLRHLLGALEWTAGVVKGDVRQTVK